MIQKQHIDLLIASGINLPTNYEHLLKLFGSLDVNLSLLKQRKQFTPWVYNFNELKKMVETSGQGFSMTNFQQILFMVPEFYIHRWEFTKSDRVELHIEIPNNVKEAIIRIKNDLDTSHVEPTEEPLNS